MANISGGSNSANKANVDTNYNLNVVTPQNETQAGFTQMSSEVDAGAVLGTRSVRAVEVSHDYRVRVGTDSPLFNMSFEGTIIAQAHIQQNLITMAVAQNSGFLIINSGSSIVPNINANIRTYRTFPLLGSYPTYCDMWLREANSTATFATSEWGFGYVSGAATPTDGIFFRRLGGGQLQAVINFAGTEVTQLITTTNVPARDGTGSFDPAETNHYLISNHNDDVEFWINDTLVARIATPSTQGGPSSSALQPVFARVINPATAPSAARRIEIGFLQVAGGDIQNNKTWSHQMVGSGGGAYQTQPGNASGQTATFAVGSAPAAGTWTASTAPATNSLGGLWTSPATLPVGSENDYPIFAYSNPAGSNALPGKTLYVTGIKINETIVTTALGATANTLIWGAGVGSTSTTLATTDGAATVGPRRIVVGTQTFAASAVAGSISGATSIDLSEAPLVCPAGTFMHITLRLITGVAAGAMRGSVTVIGYFE